MAMIAAITISMSITSLINSHTLQMHAIKSKIDSSNKHQKQEFEMYLAWRESYLFSKEVISNLSTSQDLPDVRKLIVTYNSMCEVDERKMMQYEKENGIVIPIRMPKVAPRPMPR